MSTICKSRYSIMDVVRVEKRKLLYLPMKIRVSLSLYYVFNV